MTEPLPLYHGAHKWLPSAHHNEKGANGLWNAAHLTPKPSVFSEICATMRFPAKSELSNMVAMSHMWLSGVEIQLAQTEMLVKLNTHSS